MKHLLYTRLAILACVAIAPTLTVDLRAMPFAVTGLGDCEKITKDGVVPPSPHFWNPATRTLRMHGGRNEVIAAQLMLTARSGDVAGISLEIGDSRAPGHLPADPNVQLFQEIYQYVVRANWEGASDVLPSGKWYPDALAPFYDPYSTGHRAVATPFDIQT